MRNSWQRLQLVFQTGLLVATVGYPLPSRAQDPLVCIPPVVESPARCTFDVYGTITDQDGNPIPGVSVSDGTAPYSTSDTLGFYDVYELQPGTVTLSFDHRNCEPRSDTVYVTAEAILQGGKRHDVRMTCSANSRSNLVKS